MSSSRDKKTKLINALILLIWLSGRQEQWLGTARGHLKATTPPPTMLRDLEDSGRTCHKIGPHTHTFVKTAVVATQPTEGNQGKWESTEYT